jgi:hypothetical protein
VVAGLRRNLKQLRRLDHVEWIPTRHVGAHIDAVTPPSVIRRVPKGAIDASVKALAA